MATEHTRKTGELDPRAVEIDFAPEVRHAFGDLAAAAHFSQHFDSAILSIVEQWAGSAKPSVEDVIGAFPLIARETFRHIHATGDKKATDAWHNLSSELLEKGFTLQKYRFRTNSRS